MADDNKVKSGWKHIVESESFQKVKLLLVEHKLESVAIVVLVIGLVISLFHQSSGHAIVGVISGLALSQEISHLIRNLLTADQKTYFFKIFTGIVLLVTLLLAMPIFVIAFAISVGIRWLLQPQLHH